MRRDGPAVLERMLVLRSLPAFSGLADEVLAGIARRVRERVVEPGEVLQRAEQPVNRVWVVADGLLKLVDGGRVINRTERRVGFGILGMLAERRAAYSVVADRRSRVLALDRESLLDVMDEDFTVLAHVLRFLSSLIVTTYVDLEIDFQAPEQVWPVPGHLVHDRPLDLVERVLAVRQVPAFGRSSLDSVARYARLLEERRVPAGSTLWKEGEPCSTYAHLVRGTLHGTCSRSAGRITYHPPAMPGLFGVLSLREDRWYTAVAATDLVLLRVDRETLLDLLEDDFEMAAFCLKLTARRLLRFLNIRDEKATRAH